MKQDSPKKIKWFLKKCALNLRKEWKQVHTKPTRYLFQMSELYHFIKLFQGSDKLTSMVLIFEVELGEQKGG